MAQILVRFTLRLAVSEIHVQGQRKYDLSKFNINLFARTHSHNLQIDRLQDVLILS